MEKANCEAMFGYCFNPRQHDDQHAPAQPV